MHLLLAALSYAVAATFAWSAAVVKDNAAELWAARQQFLADPERAAALHCARHKAGPCQRLAEIRIGDDGRWDDVCRHQAPRTFQVARYYRITLSCSLPLHKAPLPPLTTLLLR